MSNSISFLELELQFVLDSKKAKGRRLYFLDHEGQTSLQRQVSRGQFRKGGKWNYSFKAYLKPIIHDKLTPIDVEVSYELASNGGSRGKNKTYHKIIYIMNPFTYWEILIVA